MKNILVVALAVLSFSEISLAQSNMIFPGETKSFRTHGQRRLTVTCAQPSYTSGAMDVGIFSAKDCLSKAEVVQLSGNLFEDQNECERLVRVKGNGYGFGSVDIDGRCINIGGNGIAEFPSTEYACSIAAKLVRESQAR